MKRSTNKITFLLFLAGIAAGLVVFIFYKICVPPSPAAHKAAKKPAVHAKKTPAAAAIIVPGPVVRAAPKIAIVLDDFGYNYKNVEAVFNLKTPVTFSILPYHPYSRTIAKRVHEKGYEEILHLPLEPYENEKNVKPESNCITVNMKKEEALKKLTKALEDVPYATGISNHQGSKATEDEALMQAIFAELKTRKLFFLDSLVTSKSLCKKAAKDAGIGFGRRSVFLDNKEDLEYIRTQMQQLVKKAKKVGSAVGIGHDREKTIAALAILLPEAQKEGVEFVFLSELIK